jgi:hypothetical protein
MKVANIISESDQSISLFIFDLIQLEEKQIRIRYDKLPSDMRIFVITIYIENKQKIIIDSHSQRPNNFVY